MSSLIEELSLGLGSLMSLLGCSTTDKYRSQFLIPLTNEGRVVVYLPFVAFMSSLLWFGQPLKQHHGRPQEREAVTRTQGRVD